MSSEERIRVMVVDDHPIMRNGLRDVLDDEEDFVVVAVATDGVEAVAEAKRTVPDVIVMDVMLPNKDGIDACLEILDSLSETRVLMLTASTGENAVVRAVAAGATGYLQKFSEPEELVTAVRDVAEGRLYIPDRYLKRVFSALRGRRGQLQGSGPESLTNREKEIVRMFASGRSYAEIAEARGNKTVTIRNAIYGIQDKLGVESRQEVVVWAVQNGLLDDAESTE